MITPTVTEIPRTFTAVGRDTFIDDARDALPRSRAWSMPTRARRIAPVQAGVAGAVVHLPVAGAPSETFPRAA